MLLFEFDRWVGSSVGVAGAKHAETVPIVVAEPIDRFGFGDEVGGDLLEGGQRLLGRDVLGEAALTLDTLVGGKPCSAHPTGRSGPGADCHPSFW